ncbi:M3 family oligoendopeptidase [Virgibacillus salexigens]|uniref:M3 family oligoendopeptidase n=1 Tax=Virgibacillus salexigens TaxID=61016 RepID=UPI00190AF35C|nr:M3 family oligoendopeptidase [Virgibacillus salexigens]
MQQTNNLRWDLDIIFPGGSHSADFSTYLQELESELTDLADLVSQYNPDKESVDTKRLRILVNNLEKVNKKFREASAFISCLSAQNVKDEQASLLVSKRSELKAKFEAIQTSFNQKLVQIPEDTWQNARNQDDLNDLEFVLNEFREQAKGLLPIEQEALINDLAVDGYHAWDQMYQAIVGKMEVRLKEEETTKSYSIGQASNKLANPNRDFRKHVFNQLNRAWKTNEHLFSQTLNHLAGFRLQKYTHRNWDDVLREPLELNRMKKKTLDAMWTAINNNKHHFVTYLNKKAERLDLKKLSIYDINAPINREVKTFSYQEGADFIIKHFHRFSPKMAAFARMAFDNRWIEAEDRPDKRPGGFCTSFPESGQTRIFMTYSGTSSNIATLAHELGHAYHQHVMNDVNGLNQRYAMNVAETASTFAEMIVADASVTYAQSTDEKKGLLEDKIQRSIAFFMNIHARFLFEKRFYEERKQGMVSVNRLNKLMVDAQKEAYCDVLEEYDENFWASKLHFHMTGVPFYNFPYTFGYLFSLGIYAIAQKSDDFEDEYIKLLRDTGRMEVEDLAYKHLQVDLTATAFWEDAIQLCINDVYEYLSI